MLTPGKNFVGSPVRVSVEFENTLDTDIDPATVVLNIASPRGTPLPWASYTYGAPDGVIVRTAAGNYYADISPDRAGRWWYQWVTTGAGQTLAYEDNFLVQVSRFSNPPDIYDYCGGC